MHYRSQGKVPMPIVIRIPFGGGIGAVEHHSESPEAYFAHTAGLKVVACSNPADAYWMIQQAIARDDPIVFFEPKRPLLGEGRGRHRRRPGPAVRVPGGPRRGTTSPCSPTARWCRPRWTRPPPPRRTGRSLEVIDLRTLSPLDLDPVFESVRRTGRCVVVHEAP